MKSADRSGIAAVSASPSSSFMRAFTLVELVVCLCVIALLMATITPSLAQVMRVTGPLVHCSNNLHQLHQAISMYAQDSGGPLPVAEYEPIWPRGATRMSRRAPRLDKTLSEYGVGAKQTWLCLADVENPARYREVPLMASSYVYPPARLMARSRVRFETLAVGSLTMPLLVDAMPFHRAEWKGNINSAPAGMLDGSWGMALTDWNSKFPAGHNRVRMDGSVSSSVPAAEASGGRKDR